jgi:hypothetical protein
MFSENQVDQLRRFPDIGRDDLIRYFTLTRADLAFVDPGHGRGPSDRLGLAVQLATLPWLGFVPDEVAPAVAVVRLAERLGVDPAVLSGYGQRAHTRWDHLRLVADYLGWHSAPAGKSGNEGLGAVAAGSGDGA